MDILKNFTLYIAFIWVMSVLKHGAYASENVNITGKFTDNNQEKKGSNAGHFSYFEMLKENYRRKRDQRAVESPQERECPNGKCTTMN